MPYGNSDKTWGVFWICTGAVCLAVMIFAVATGKVPDRSRKFEDAYRQGHLDGYKKASDEAVATVERKISEIENRLTNH